MSKSALIASVALYFAGRAAAADHEVAHVTTGIVSKAAKAFARARAARPEKAENQRESNFTAPSC